MELEFVHINLENHRSINLHMRAITFHGVPEALGGGGVIGRRVEGVDLQTVIDILGFRQSLDHGSVDVPSRVPPDGRRLGT